MGEPNSDKLVARFRNGTLQEKAREIFFLPYVEFEVARPAIPWLIRTIREVDLEQQPLGPWDWKIILSAPRAVGYQFALAWTTGRTDTPEARMLRDEIMRMLASDHPQLKHEMLIQLSFIGPAAGEYMPRIAEIAAGPTDGYPDSVLAKSFHAIHQLDPSAAFSPEFAVARRDYLARCRHWAEVYAAEGKAALAAKFRDSANALAESGESMPEPSFDDLVIRLRHAVAPRRAMAVVDLLTRDFEQAKPAIPALLELVRGLDLDLQPLDRWDEAIARFGPAALANFYRHARAAGAGDLPEAQAAWEELVRSAQSPHREAVHIAIHQLGELGAAASAALSILCPIARGPSDGGPMPTRARALLAIHRIEPSKSQEAEFVEARRELAAACIRWAEEYRATGYEARATEWTETARLFS